MRPGKEEMKKLIQEAIRKRMEEGLRERLGATDPLEQDGIREVLVESVMKGVPEVGVDVSNVTVSFPEMSEDERIVREVLEEPLNEVRIEVKMTLNEPLDYRVREFGLARTLDGIGIWDYGADGEDEIKPSS